MRIAVDICVGRKGVALIERAGHQVVAVADEGEADESWCERGRRAGATVFVAIDLDVAIWCHEHDLHFFKAHYGDPGTTTAERLVAALDKHRRKE